MNTSLDSERAWLLSLQASNLVGYCFLDTDGRLVQRYGDQMLRDTLIAFQAEKVRQLELDERAIAGQADPKPYPTN